MDVLVDSSVWVSFFRGMKGEETVAKALDYLLAGDEAVVNEVIKTEVMPMMIVKGEDATLLDAVRRQVPLFTLDKHFRLMVKVLPNLVFWPK